MEDRHTQAAGADYSPIFEIHDSKALHEMAEKAEPARMLFGEFWAEGEMAILFGDHGVGKSILAAQIADSIARGAGAEPFGMMAKPKTVLYLDLEQTSAQFAARYAGELRPHKFTRNFQHIAVDPFAEVPENYQNFVEYLSKATEQLIRERRPKVVIVDSLAHLKRSNDITRDVLPFVRVLGRLRREMGLSILLVAPSQRRLTARTMEIGDMQAARGLCAFADSIFAIGTSGTDTVRRYVKQLKSRNREILHDRSHTVAVRIDKDPAGFLRLVFENFAAETAHFRDLSGHRDWNSIDRAKQWHDEGLSYGLIGIRLGISKTSAHRLVQMWVPPPASSTPAVNDPETEPPVEPDDDLDEPEEIDEEPDEDVQDEHIEVLQGPPDLGALAGFPATTPGLDRRGRKIWIEKRDENGKPVVWYSVDANGVRFRHVRDVWGVDRERIE